jgi:hypothetical protein
MKRRYSFLLFALVAALVAPMAPAQFGISGASPREDSTSPEVPSEVRTELEGTLCAAALREALDGLPLQVALDSEGAFAAISLAEWVQVVREEVAFVQEYHNSFGPHPWTGPQGCPSP